MNKSQKLVRMVEMMARPGGVSASEIRSTFELDERTFRRYLHDLRSMNFPIEDDGRAEERVLTVAPKWRRTGVYLTLPEVLSLHFGRTLFNFLEGTRYTADITSALERLHPAISKTHPNLSEELDDKFLAVAEPTKQYTNRHNKRLDNIVSALVYNNPIQGRYRKPNGVARTYTLHPYTLATYRQGLYVFAYDTRAEIVKTFALERFVHVERRRIEFFDRPAEWRPQVHLEHAFGIVTGPPERVSVAFSERVVGYIRERTWHPSQALRTLRDGRLELSMTVAVTAELQTWIQGFGANAEVLEPAKLVRRVAASLTRAAKRYSGPTSRW